MAAKSLDDFGEKGSLLLEDLVDPLLYRIGANYDRIQ